MNPHDLILVDEEDRVLGRMEKLEVHRRGLLHRAFSVFIFNSKNQLLLQQRADEKYHSPGLWTNTCCSHPFYGEELSDAVKRRLKEEMGLHVEAKFAFHFIYHVTFDNGLTEHELDHVFIGTSDAIPQPEVAEVKSWKYMSLEDINADLKQNPAHYTEWFKICFEKVKEHYYR